MGYGANQKTCYRRALEEGADIVIMVHPGYRAFSKELLEQLPLEASSINFTRSVRYGFSCLHPALSFRMAKWGFLHIPRFPEHPDRAK